MLYRAKSEAFLVQVFAQWQKSASEDTAMMSTGVTVEGN